MSQDAHSKNIEASNNPVDQSDSPSEIAPSPAQEEKATGYDNAVHDFDTGLKAWLQVLGAFFLFFNSWYA